MTTLTNAQVRFEAAVNGVRAHGVHLATNVMTCCRSCTGPADLGLTEEQFKNEPNAFHFGGQGNELTWRQGQPHFLDEQPEDDEDDEYESFGRRNSTRPAEVVYFYHRGPDLKAAQTLTEVFRGEGFEVDWDDTADTAVVVHVG